MVVILKYLTLLQWDRSSEIDPKFSGWNHFWSLQLSRSWGKGHVFKNRQNVETARTKMIITESLKRKKYIYFCKWTVSRWRLLLQCPLKLSSESMVGRLKWLTSFTSFTKLSDQRTHVKSLVTVLLAHFPLYKTQTRFEMVAKLWIILPGKPHCTSLLWRTVHKNVKNCIIFVFDMPDIALCLCFAAFPNIRGQLSF